MIKKPKILNNPINVKINSPIKLEKVPFSKNPEFYIPLIISVFALLISALSLAWSLGWFSKFDLELVSKGAYLQCGTISNNIYGLVAISTPITFINHGKKADTVYDVKVIVRTNNSNSNFTSRFDLNEQIFRMDYLNNIKSWELFAPFELGALESTNKLIQFVATGKDNTFLELNGLDIIYLDFYYKTKKDSNFIYSSTTKFWVVPDVKEPCKLYNLVMVTNPRGFQILPIDYSNVT